MKTADLLVLHDTLAQFSRDGGRYSTKFAYAVARNLRTLAPVAECFREATSPAKVPELVAYDEDRLAMLRALAVKDEQGNPKMKGNDFDIADPAALADAFAALQARHPGLEAAVEAYNARVRELCEVEEPVKLLQVAFELLPEDLTVAQADALLPMVADDA